MKLVSIFGTAAATLLLAPALAHATWADDPVTVQSTSDVCSRVAAAPDGADGAIVVWQQNDAANPGVYHLYARHVLANGDLDASWPAGGAPVSTGTAQRAQLGALTDAAGGAYVWWTEGASIYVTRLAANGGVAASWPARGRSIGTLGFTSNNYVPRRPDFRTDGQGGLWAGWLTGSLYSTGGRVIHLGPNNTGAGGWPNQARGYALSELGELAPQTLTFGYGPTADGGAWIAWGDSPLDATGFHAGLWHLSRVTASGTYATGWDAWGVEVAPFDGELLGAMPYYAGELVAVSPDGGDGAYLFRTDVSNDGYSTNTHRAVYHLGADGTPAADWPAGGVVPNYQDYAQAYDGGPDGSLGLRYDSVRGLTTMGPGFSTAGISLDVTHLSSDGTRTARASAAIETQPGGVDLAFSATGDIFLADYNPNGPSGPYQGPALLRVDQALGDGTKGPGFIEVRPEILQHFYDDVGIAAIGDGRAIFAWAQSNDRHGVFVRKLGPNGEITGAPAGTVVSAMRVRFAPGRGVVASFGAAADGRVQLVDVSGRVRASADVRSSREVTLAGTDALAPGVYFATHRRVDGSRENARVVVVR